MRVLVTGVKGQLGYDVMNELKKQGLTGIGVDVDEMDITDAEACRRVITEAKPDAVIHCAAYTAVDAAEQNMELCRVFSFLICSSTLRMTDFTSMILIGLLMKNSMPASYALPINSFAATWEIMMHFALQPLSRSSRMT